MNDRGEETVSPFSGGSESVNAPFLGCVSQLTLDFPSLSLHFS